jgi:hypothetical protein
LHRDGVTIQFHIAFTLQNIVNLSTFLVVMLDGILDKSDMEITS